MKRALARTGYSPSIVPGLADRLPPPIDDATRPLWTGGLEGKLLIQRCEQCRRWAHPPVAGPCPSCGGALVPEPASGKGTVFTYTVNAHTYNPAVPVPYVIAIVELAEQAGLRFFTNLVNCDPADVRVGMAVRVVFEDHGDWAVPLFEPDAS